MAKLKQGRRAETNQRLAEIAKLMEEGACPEKYETELDQLLGTGLPERDPQAEAAWERRRRSGRSETT